MTAEYAMQYHAGVMVNIAINMHVIVIGTTMNIAPPMIDSYYDYSCMISLHKSGIHRH